MCCTMEATTKPPKAARRRRRFGRVYPRPGGPRGSWLVQFPDPSGARARNGRTKYLTKSVSSEAEGKALLAEIEKALLLGRFTPAAEPAPETDLTLLQAVDAYLDAKRGEGRAQSGIRRYATSRSVIARSPVAATKVADLTARDVESYMRWRRAHRYHRRSRDAVVVVGGIAPSTSTVNRDLALISAALGRLVRLGLARTNVAKAIRRGREPVRARPVLTREEAKALLDAADPHLRVLLTAGLCTGARPSELLALKWRDVSLDGDGSITIYRQKVELGDTLPLHPRLADALRGLKAARPEARDEDVVLLSSRGTEGWDYKRAFAKAVRRAGLSGKRITLYAATRHTLASHWKGTPGDLQVLLGHRSILTTQRYIRALNDRTRASLEAVDLVG